ncbi:MAG: hypothetical protein HAW59_06240 [Betaproteobacteria bacterium]|nr:hypothetical protein [Betaproteobacteria bacterium]
MKKLFLPAANGCAVAAAALFVAPAGMRRFNCTGGDIYIQTKNGKIIKHGKYKNHGG